MRRPNPNIKMYDMTIINRLKRYTLHLNRLLYPDSAMVYFTPVDVKVFSTWSKEERVKTWFKLTEASYHNPFTLTYKQINPFCVYNFKVRCYLTCALCQFGYHHGECYTFGSRHFIYVADNGEVEKVKGVDKLVKSLAKLGLKDRSGDK